MLGLSLHFWEDVMIWALAIVGAAGVVVGVATFAVVRLQRAELTASTTEFAKYKLETAERISETDAAAAKAKYDAEQARLDLAKYRAPRSLTAEQKSIMIEELRGKLSDILVVAQAEAEARLYALQFEQIVRDAGIKIHTGSLMPGDTMVGGSPGVTMWSPTAVISDILDASRPWPGPPNTTSLGSIDPLFAALFKAGLWNGFAAIKYLPNGSTELATPTMSTIYVGQKDPW